MAELRLGELLVKSGALSQRQVEHILAHQEHSGEPFGVIAERLFSIDPEAVEAAWAERYAVYTRTIDPTDTVCEPRALAMVTRRQAWQFRVLPIQLDAKELMVATTQIHLRRALRFATNVIGVPVYFVMAAPEPLGRALCRCYPLPGMTPRSVIDSSLDRLLGHRFDAAA